MKKLLTIAIAAAVAAPMAVSAETTLYGRVDTALISTDNDTAGGDTWDVSTNSSRIGLKGSEDLGNGLKAIFQYEFGSITSEGGGYGDALNNRLGYVGLSGGFGTIAIGRQWTPYFGSVNKTDIMNLNPSAGALDGDSVDANANGHYLGLTRTGGAVAYVSPDFNGFSGKLALVMNDDRGTTTSDGLDAFNLSLDYNNGPLSVGFSYLDYDSATGGADRWGLAGKYNFGNFALIGQYEDMDDTVSGANDGASSFGIAAQAYFGNNTLSFEYGERDFDNNSADLDNWGISAHHSFSKMTRVYVDYQQQETAASVDESTFGVGIRHDF